MSDTPLSSFLSKEAKHFMPNMYVVPAFALEQLERENAALRAISIEAMISNTAFRMKELERENARLRAALVEAINKRAETTEWRTDHPTTTGNPERWVRDELCIKWRAAIDAARKEAQP